MSRHQLANCTQHYTTSEQSVSVFVFIFWIYYTSVTLRHSKGSVLRTLQCIQVLPDKSLS